MSAPGQKIDWNQISWREEKFSGTTSKHYICKTCRWSFYVHLNHSDLTFCPMCGINEETYDSSKVKKLSTKSGLL